MPNPNPVPGRRIIISGKRPPVAVPLATHRQPQIAALILDDGTVRRILTNDALVSSIPFLVPYASKLKEQTRATKPRGCGGCQGGQTQLQGDVGYNAVRYGIVNSSVEQQDKIKQALNVKQLRVYYLDISGNRARATV